MAQRQAWCRQRGAGAGQRGEAARPGARCPTCVFSSGVRRSGCEGDDVVSACDCPCNMQLQQTLIYIHLCLLQLHVVTSAAASFIRVMSKLANGHHPSEECQNAQTGTTRAKRPEPGARPALARTVKLYPVVGQRRRTGTFSRDFYTPSLAHDGDFHTPPRPWDTTGTFIPRRWQNACDGGSNSRRVVRRAEALSSRCAAASYARRGLAIHVSIDP